MSTQTAATESKTKAPPSINDNPKTDDAAAVAETESPTALVLNNPDILTKHIFPFVGIGNYIYIASVGKCWKANYRQFWGEFITNPANGGSNRPGSVFD